MNKPKFKVGDIVTYVGPNNFFILKPGTLFRIHSPGVINYYGKSGIGIHFSYLFKPELTPLEEELFD